MIWILDEDDSIAYLEGGWDQYDVEERTLAELERREVTDVVAVVLSDNSAIAFYVGRRGEVL